MRWVIRRPVHGRWMALCGMAVMLTVSGCQTVAPRRTALPQTVRAVWVTRWDYKSPRDIATVMENCRRAGFNTVLFQVRGNGTALYRSRMEPWAEEFGGRDPGFDPLAVACHEAQRRGLQLHAWVNVVPGWRGKEPPKDGRQLYHARADWFWRDARGRREPLGWYNNLNVCYPEVRRYLADIMTEIVARYPVDGLHMDYIRFPNEWNDAYPAGAQVPDYPRDPRTLEMFRRATGQTPERSPGAWSDWRTDQVTQLVRDIRAAISRARPGVVLSAAVGAEPDRAKRTHFQDSQRWMAEGLIDAVFPMNYAGSLPAFDQNLGHWTSVPRRVPVVMGVYFDKRDAGLVRGQIERSGATGAHFCAFAYNSLFERLDQAGRPIMDAQSPSRAALRQQVLPFVQRLASSR